MKGVPVLEQLAVISHGSMYKTKPLEELLKEKFDLNRPLFGGSLGEGTNEAGEMATKVAVTSTISVGQHAVVISNYNRPENPMLSMCDTLCFRLFSVTNIAKAHHIVFKERRSQNWK